MLKERGKEIIEYGFREIYIIEKEGDKLTVIGRIIKELEHKPPEGTKNVMRLKRGKDEKEYVIFEEVSEELKRKVIENWKTSPVTP